ncbi:MAG: TolC family protein [Verrucomicrobia bacterium]|nr:TolC family protein [Verrucomicrobiota bacterium]
MKKWLLLALLCASLAADPLSLAQLIDIGLKNNPETTKSWSAVKRAQAQIGVAQSDYYPAIGVQGKLTHGRDVKFVNGPEVVFTNYGADLALSYVLFDFGERKAGVAATRDALSAAKWSSDFAIQKVMFQVSESYYEYLSAQEQLKTKKSSLQDAEGVRDAAEDLFKAGLKSERDQAVSRATVAELQMDLAGARAASEIAYGKLLMALGLPMSEKIEVQIAGEPKKESVGDLVAAAEEKRADVLAMKATLSEMHERVKKSRRGPRPKLKLMGQGGWMEYAKHRDRGYNYTAGVTLDIPLFKGFENTYLKRVALADEEITAAELKALQEAVALEVLTYSSSVKAAEETLSWSDQFLEEATKSYDAALESYKAGLSSIFDLVQTQRMLSDARMKKTQARTKWLVSLAELAFATGSLEK